MSFLDSESHDPAELATGLHAVAVAGHRAAVGLADLRRVTDEIARHMAAEEDVD